MTKTTTLWLPNPITLPDEHRIFQADPSILRNRNYVPRDLKTDEFGAWAIADNSGSTPEETDDGIWWLNFNKNILLSTANTNPHIPLINPQGTSSEFVTNTAGLFILTDMFRWTVNVGGKLYRTVRW